MSHWSDTSFLLSVYLWDINTQAALTAMRRVQTSLPFTPFHRHEFRNAVRLAVFHGRISDTQRDAAFDDLGADLDSGVLKAVALPWPGTFREAERLSALHTETLGNRGMDILHVAAAVTLGATDFLTFDQRQRALAQAAGLRVAP